MQVVQFHIFSSVKELSPGSLFIKFPWIFDNNEGMSIFNENSRLAHAMKSLGANLSPAPADGHTSTQRPHLVQESNPIISRRENGLLSSDTSSAPDIIPGCFSR